MFMLGKYILQSAEYFFVSPSCLKIFTIVKQWKSFSLEPSVDQMIAISILLASLQHFKRSFCPRDDWDKLESTMKCLMTSCGKPSGKRRKTTRVDWKSSARLNSVPATSGIFFIRLILASRRCLERKICPAVLNKKIYGKHSWADV